ncbi:prion-inhibition and propagation-domain-containing protein [Bisporella sp. PMI_857]|nr:prion-inhibition and propagation-domain-containing protein [Bisporella sp. PMI_857]
MAEIFGVVTGVAGLAGVFTSCVDCFEYVQFARSFGKDYERSILKLDIVRLRFTRWGQAVGVYIDGKMVRDPQRQYIAATPDQLELCRDILDQIEDIFNDSERVSTRFKTKAEKAGKDDQLAIWDPAVDLPDQPRSVHVKTRDIAKKRQKGTNVLQKISWALYEKSKFDRLIEDVSGLVDSLETVFPPEVLELATVICQTEVEEYEKVDDLILLGEAAGRDDRLLTETITRAVTTKGNQYENFEINGDAGFEATLGNTYGVGRNREGDGNVYKGFKMGGKGSTHLGDTFQGSNTHSAS